MRTPLRIGIVGGGIGGLTCAYRLERLARLQGYVIEGEIFETTSHWGGVISTRKTDDCTLEEGPDCFISEKPAGLALAKELGLESEIIGTNPAIRQSFIVKNGKLLAVPEGLYLMAPAKIWPFVCSPLVSPLGKLRMAMDYILPAKPESEDESLGSFVRRRLGQEALDRVAAPMIAGIYTANPDKLSLRATMPRFLELEQKYGSVIRGLRAQRGHSSKASGPRYSLFVSLKGGMSTLPTKLVSEIRDFKMTPNTSITRAKSMPDASWQITLSSGEVKSFDVLCLALPSPGMARILKDEEPELSNHLGQLPYASTGIVNFLYSRNQIAHPLNGMGFVVPDMERKSLLACSFLSQKFEGRSTSADTVILRAFIGGESGEEVLAQSDERLIELVTGDLRDLLGITDAPKAVYLRRWSRSIAQYPVGHLPWVDQAEQLRKKKTGLYLIGNMFRGVGIPDVIAAAETAAKEIADDAFVTAPEVRYA